MADAGIVRNRAKIEAAVRNARAVLELDGPSTSCCGRSRPDRAPRARPRWPTSRRRPPESAAMAKELKRRGFAFVGPTTCYALMQATGMVDDHVADCLRACPRSGRPVTPSGACDQPRLPRIRDHWSRFTASTAAVPPAPGGRGAARRRKHAWRR